MTTSTTSKTASTTVQTTTKLNQTNFFIIGIYGTTAGGSTGGFDGMFSGPSEMPLYAMDNSTATKYLNFGQSSSVYAPGIGTGFIVTPSISNSKVVCALLFATAGDSPNRDPITVTLEGSNATTITTFNLSSSWTLIYNGSTGISPTVDPGRSTYVARQNFSNTIAYASYRLLITSKRGSDNSVQYSEAQLISCV